jgi:septation ring formation regulator EzrA
MNIFNLFRKHEELRQEFDAFKADTKKTVNGLVDSHNQSQADYQVLVRRFDELEKSFLDMNRSFSEDMRELRADINTPRRSKSTLRPWSLLRSVAEAGERKMAEKPGV